MSLHRHFIVKKILVHNMIYGLLQIFWHKLCLLIVKIRSFSNNSSRFFVLEIWGLKTFAALGTLLQQWEPTYIKFGTLVKLWEKSILGKLDFSNRNRENERNDILKKYFIIIRSQWVFEVEDWNRYHWNHVILVNKWLLFESLHLWAL